MRYDWIGADRDFVDKYADVCHTFAHDEVAFADFKRNVTYNRILEGNEKLVGKIAYNQIADRNKLPLFLENINKLKENELYGNPRKEDYFDLKDIAPSTLRYFNSFLEIEEVLGDAKPKTIIEVGGGYGGLCKTLSVFYDFDSYTLVDMPEVLELCERYLRNFPDLHKKVKYISSNDIGLINGAYDLFIGDSSLAECTSAIQIRYAQIARKCEYAYVVYNSFHTPNGMNNFLGFISHLMFSSVVSPDKNQFVFTYKALPNVAVITLKRLG
jgi:putative sugar O-methyltransferase